VALFVAWAGEFSAPVSPAKKVAPAKTPAERRASRRVTPLLGLIIMVEKELPQSGE
jgi:hypothetical protein